MDGANQPFVVAYSNRQEINNDIEKNNDLIESINTRLGTKYPFERFKEFAISDTDEYMLRFAAAEREYVVHKKARLSKMFEVCCGILTFSFMGISCLTLVRKSNMTLL